MIVSVLFPGFTVKSVNFVFLVVLVIVYIVEVILYQFSSKNWQCLLYAMGAKYTYSMTHSFHLHRFVAPIFLHNSFSHLIRNVLPLAMTGF